MVRAMQEGSTAGAATEGVGWAGARVGVGLAAEGVADSVAEVVGAEGTEVATEEATEVVRWVEEGEVGETQEAKMVAEKGEEAAARRVEEGREEARMVEMREAAKGAGAEERAAAGGKAEGEEALMEVVERVVEVLVAKMAAGGAEEAAVYTGEVEQGVGQLAAVGVVEGFVVGSEEVVREEAPAEKVE